MPLAIRACCRLARPRVNLLGPQYGVTARSWCTLHDAHCALPCSKMAAGAASGQTATRPKQVPFCLTQHCSRNSVPQAHLVRIVASGGGRAVGMRRAQSAIGHKRSVD